MSETWRLALRNLGRNRRRNLATSAAIALGFAAVMALGGYSYRVENFLRVHAVFVRQVGHILIYQAGGLDQFSTKPQAYSLNPTAQAKIAAIVKGHPNVAFFGPQLSGSGLIGNGCQSLPFIATSIDPEIDRRIRSHPELATWAPQFSRYSKGQGLWEYPKGYGAIALSEGLASLLGKPHVISDFPPGKAPLVVVDCQSPEKRAQIAQDANVQLMSGNWAGGISAQDGEIVAHYSTGISETNHSALITSLEHLQQLYGTDHVSSISLWLADPQELPATLASLSRSFQESGLNLDLYLWNDERISPFYRGTMDFLYTLVAFIAFILGTTIVFSIFNATTITVIERSTEIGMFRALGFTRGQIRSLFLREIVGLALLSLLAGAVLGGLGIFILNNSHVIFHPPGIAGGVPLILTPSLPFSLAAALVIFMLALVSTYLAIYKATSRGIPLLLSDAQR